MADRSGWSHGSTGLPCRDCNRPHEEYTVNNRLWNLVMRPGGIETDYEYVCLTCFHLRVQAHIDCCCRSMEVTPKMTHLLTRLRERQGYYEWKAERYQAWSLQHVEAGAGNKGYPSVVKNSRQDAELFHAAADAIEALIQ